MLENIFEHYQIKVLLNFFFTQAYQAELLSGIFHLQEDYVQTQIKQGLKSFEFDTLCIGMSEGEFLIGSTYNPTLLTILLVEFYSRVFSSK